MRPVLICPDDLVEHLVGSATFPGERPVYLIEKPSVRARIARRGDRTLTGDPEDVGVYRRVF